MLKAKQNQVWPPEQSSCPDFWDWDESRKMSKYQTIRQLVLVQPMV